MKKKVFSLVILLLLITIVLSGCSERTPTAIVLGKTYSNFGFSFKYSNDMIIEDQGFASETADDDSGILIGDVEYTSTDTYHIIKISWFNIGPSEESVKDQNLLDSLEAGFLLIENDQVEIIKGQISESTLAGYKMNYQNYEYHVEELVVYGILGAVYCDENYRMYTINIGYSEGNVYSVFQDYVNYFTPAI